MFISLSGSHIITRGTDQSMIIVVKRLLCLCKRDQLIKHFIQFPFEHFHACTCWHRNLSFLKMIFNQSRLSYQKISILPHPGLQESLTGRSRDRIGCCPSSVDVVNHTWSAGGIDSRNAHKAGWKSGSASTDGYLETTRIELRSRALN